MFHPITKTTKLVTLSHAYDYLSAGVEYLATPSKSGKEVRFDRRDGSSGTTLRHFQWVHLMRSGIATISNPIAGFSDPREIRASFLAQTITSDGYLAGYIANRLLEGN